MTPISNDFVSYTAYASPRTVYLANKSTIDAIGEGTVRLFTIISGVKHEVHLQHMLLVPSLANSLFSVKMVNQLGFSALFRPYGVLIENPNEAIIAESEEGGSLYDLRIVCQSVHMASIACTPDWLTLNVLHKHLGHPSISTLQQMIQKGLIKGANV